ncbi:hypothetical protein QTP88_014930 [Uroleucon formosanum]
MKSYLNSYILHFDCIIRYEHGIEYLSTRQISSIYYSKRINDSLLPQCYIVTCKRTRNDCRYGLVQRNHILRKGLQIIIEINYKFKFICDVEVHPYFTSMRINENKLSYQNGLYYFRSQPYIIYDISYVCIFFSVLIFLHSIIYTSF